MWNHLSNLIQGDGKLETNFLTKPYMEENDNQSTEIVKPKTTTDQPKL